MDQAFKFFPFVSFLAGLGGGLHCIGMCGGLVTATCNNTKDVARYQFGRLLGYLLLGGLAGLIGNSISQLVNEKLFSLLGAMLIGGLFIHWGVSSFKGKKAEIPTPKVLKKTYFNLWGSLVKNNTGKSKSFFTGLISIMLPCGLLYGLVLATLSLSNVSEALFSMLFFWLGTLPAMITGPVLIQKILKPLKNKWPKFCGVALILVGIFTIYQRTPLNFSKNADPQIESKEITCH